jgi:transcriptional regulator with XRE-family HTH domain
MSLPFGPMGLQRTRPRVNNIHGTKKIRALRLVRKVARLSQEDVAAAAAVDSTFISLLERGERDLSKTGYEVVRNIAGVFNLTPEELLTLTRADYAKG